MELFSAPFLEKSLRLEGSMSGWQQLYWDNQLVAQCDATGDTEAATTHRFQLLSGETPIQCELNVELSWQPFRH